MFIQRFVTQPIGDEYRSLLATGAAAKGFSHFDAGVAYATLQGVAALEDTLDTYWGGWKKRWLVGIDWCRTEPLALQRLSVVGQSRVRIHDGARLANIHGCVPSVPFHPKAYIIRSASQIAVVSGSGNLSANGLKRGHEVGSLVFVDESAGKAEKQLRDACRSVSDWFERMWEGASPLTRDLLGAYQSRFDTSREMPTPTDDDVIGAVQLERRRGLTAEMLVQLRMAPSLWIEAGNLHENRGTGLPGNQLMMSPMTRVFFGFPASDLPRDTLVGHVFIQFEKDRVERSLRFSNNSMDVLSLPIPGQEGPDAYDREVLLFTKSTDRTGTHFVLRLGGASDRTSWRKRSERLGTSFEMTSGRKWGVF